MSQYLKNNKEGYISNKFGIQRHPKTKEIVDGLVVTTLTDDYIPPIILARTPEGQTYIVDGGSRTAAFLMIRYGNHKIKSSVENPIIKYNKMNKNEKGKIVWEEAEFDIRNKTYDQFPKELQKQFDEYQVETVVYECEKHEIDKYFRRFNIHTSMNANEKMFIYLPEYAEKIREIIDRPFFLNNSVFTESEKEKGVLERVIAETAMCTFHMDKWTKDGKKIAKYLNDNSSDTEFETLDKYISRLENIITDDIKKIFNSKDSFVWITLFDKFSKLNIKDEKFAEFLRVFKTSLRNKEVDGQLFDTVDQSGSTKDKAIILAKLHILETLMCGFLDINQENLQEVDVFEFVKENVKEDITEEEIDFCNCILDELTLNVNNNTKLLDKHNRPSLIALVAYACEEDLDLDNWIIEFFSTNVTYKLNQKENYTYMKEHLNSFMNEGRKSA
jgi:hypothetical protein